MAKVIAICGKICCRKTYYAKLLAEKENAVILDWGFWHPEHRESLRVFFRKRNVACQWHYVDVDDETWHRNIAERNSRVLAGEGGPDYYLDDGLMKKLLSLWEAPGEDEIGVWYRPEGK